MDDLTLAPPAAAPLDLSAFTQTATPPFASPRQQAPPPAHDKRQLLKLSMMLPLAMKAGPGAVQGLLAGFAQHDAQQQTLARQGQMDQRQLDQDAQQRQYQQGTLDNQRQQNQRALLNDFATKVGSLDDPAAIDALTQLYTAQASSLGLKPEALSAYAQQYRNPTRIQKRAAEKKIAQLKSEYGADKWMEMGAQFTHQLAGSDTPVSFDQLLALAGQARDPNAPKPTVKDRRGFTTKDITLNGKRMLAGYDPDSNTYYAPGDTRTPLTGDIQEYNKPPAATGSGQGGGDTAEAIADAIIRGEQPPETTGLYRYGAAVKAILAKKGYNQSAALTDWRATQAHVRTLNSAQQTRLNQAVDNAAHSLDVIEDLAAQWQAGRFPVLNRGRLAAAKSGALGPQAQQIATALDAQIADVTAELGNVYMGGNSPTDHALSLASKNLSASWSQPQLAALIKQARTNLQIRRNSIVNAGVAGASAGNPYAPTQPTAPAGVDEWVRDAAGKLVKKGAK